MKPKLIEAIKAGLQEDKYGPPVIEEAPISPNRYILIVIWDGFSDVPEPDRQDRVWSQIRKTFGAELVTEFKELGFILTWTNEENEAYKTANA